MDKVYRMMGKMAELSKLNLLHLKGAYFKGKFEGTLRCGVVL